jgi:hypothetical protein
MEGGTYGLALPILFERVRHVPFLVVDDLLRWHGGLAVYVVRFADKAGRGAWGRCGVVRRGVGRKVVLLRGEEEVVVSGLGNEGRSLFFVVYHRLFSCTSCSDHRRSSVCPRLDCGNSILPRSSAD